jgi:tetratricopeptide (TPR) repeat protein
MDEPLVSVLIRSMGRPMLQTAIDSIAAQDYPNIEVTIVAASGAAHPAVAAQCGPFPQHLVGNGNRLPRADAANFGLDSARGDYCVFLDDDDFHDPDHVSGLMTALAANPGMRVAYSRVRVIGADGRERAVFGSLYDRLALHERNYIQIGAALFERGLAASCRFDPAVGAYDDWDFWLQCSECTEFAFRDHPSTNWCAESGESGAGDGANFDPAVNETSRDAVQAKWASVRDGLIERLIAFTEAGYAAQQRGDQAHAEQNYLDALRIHPSDPYALNLYAMLLFTRGSVAEASSCLRRALGAHPERADVACNLARVEMHVGNLTIAQRLLEAVVRREPGNAVATALLSRLTA